VVTAIKQQVIVQPGGVIEIRSPELTPGASAEVIVLVGDNGPAGPQPPPSTWAAFMGSGRGRFKSVEEIDAYVRGLRDEWDR
jgi:hypothetical protein